MTTESTDTNEAPEVTELPLTDELYVVYTVGKVGSGAINNALKQLSGIKIYHVHYAMTVFNGTDTRAHDDEDRVQTEHLHGEVNRLEGYKIRMMHMMRDPIARVLSHFFTNHNFTPFQLNSPSNPVTHEEIITEFLRSPVQNEFRDWYRKEFTPFTGENILQSDFNQDEGWGLLKGKKYDILSLQCETSNELKEEKIKEFLGHDIPPILHENTTSDKAGDRVSQLYKAFKKEAALPERYVNHMYDNDVVKFFYSKAQIDAFKKKWLKT